MLVIYGSETPVLTKILVLFKEKKMNMLLVCVFLISTLVSSFVAGNFIGIMMSKPSEITILDWIMISSLFLVMLFSALIVLSRTRKSLKMLKHSELTVLEFMESVKVDENTYRIQRQWALSLLLLSGSISAYLKHGQWPRDI
jgi:uncharacterized membrane protein YoaK (UPF0700 family)